MNPEIHGTWCKFQIMMRKPKTARKRNRNNIFSKSPPKTAGGNINIDIKRQVKLKAQIDLTKWTSMISKVNVGTNIQAAAVSNDNRDIADL